jgi:DMSO/TMAO reductase YedYZ molybdopterin-dependent catalytic subunit
MLSRTIKSLWAVAALLLVLTSCGAKLPDISAYGDTPIEVSGLLDEDFTVTPNVLAKLKLDTSTATGATAKAGTVSGIGPTLITFLEQYGRVPADFKYIRFIASDEYRITLAGNKHTDDVVLFAIAGNGKPLPEPERPMRLIVPTAESNQWIYSVIRIEFVPDE